jgi:hypothetical protein
MTERHCKKRKNFRSVWRVHSYTNSSKITTIEVQVLSYQNLAMLLRYKDKNILNTTAQITSEIQRIKECLKNNGSNNIRNKMA